VKSLDQIDEHYRTLPGTSNDRLSEYGYNARGEMTAENVVTGGLLSANRQEYGNGAEFFYTYDANGNVCELLNASGAIVAHYQYDAFGKEVVKTGAAADWNRFRYSTKWAERTHLWLDNYNYTEDYSPGLVSDKDFSYYGYRYYSADEGRWLSRDPIGESGGFNLYGIVGNDSTNAIDILGLAWHHLLPPEVFDVDYLDEIGLLGKLNPDAKEFGIELDYEEHIRAGGKGGSIHNPADGRIGWNKEWKKWRDDLQSRGRTPSLDDIREKLSELEGEYEDFVKKGNPVNDDYSGKKFYKRKKETADRIKKLKRAGVISVVIVNFYLLLSEANDACEAEKIRSIVINLERLKALHNTPGGDSYAHEAARLIHEFFPAPYDPGITSVQLEMMAEK
jgi:hypothetical protein